MTFAIKKHELSTGANGQREDAASFFCPFDRAVVYDDADNDRHGDDDDALVRDAALACHTNPSGRAVRRESCNVMMMPLPESCQ